MGSVLGPWSVGFAGSKIGEVKIGEVMAHGASAKRMKLMGSPWVSLPAGGRLKKTLFPPLVSQCPKNAHIRWQRFTGYPQCERKTCAGEQKALFIGSSCPFCP